MKICGKKFSPNLKRSLKRNIATGINIMKEKEILDVVYKQIALAYQEKLTDKAPEHFRQLK